MFKLRISLNEFMVTADTLFNLPSVAESIISYASEQKAGLIVIGTRARSGLKKRLVPGSVASAVVAHAGCPVLVVR
jgi:nucleotide-binding universal stress UspA family protein